MICQPRGDETVPTDESVRSDHEEEITRLTWAVIDGKASELERRRLAELVGRQHERRGG